MSKRGNSTSLDALVLEFIDHSIPIKLGLMLNLIDVLARFRLLKGL